MVLLYFHGFDTARTDLHAFELGLVKMCRVPDLKSQSIRF